MTELEFKKMFEKYAENIVKEIITPIENKIADKIKNCSDVLEFTEKKIKSIDRRQIKLARDLNEMAKWIERVDARAMEIQKEPVKIELLQRLDKYHYEINQHVRDACDDLTAHKESLLNMDISRYTREFELRCVQYMQAVERKAKAVAEGTL